MYTNEQVEMEIVDEFGEMEVCNNLSSVWHTYTRYIPRCSNSTKLKICTVMKWKIQHNIYKNLQKFTEVWLCNFNCCTRSIFGPYLVPKVHDVIYFSQSFYLEILFYWGCVTWLWFNFLVHPRYTKDFTLSMFNHKSSCKGRS